MIFVRVFFVTVVLAAFVALGYAFWLTFQPLDAPPVDSGEDQAAVEHGEGPEQSEASAGRRGSTLDDRPHESPVLDQLRRPAQMARGVTAEARRVRDDFGQMLPDEDDRNLDYAWRTIKQAGHDFMELEAVDAGELPVGIGHGRVHASGAPAYNGGGRPAARQPGIDWYKAGGAPPKE